MPIFKNFELQYEYGIYAESICNCCGAHYVPLEAFKKDVENKSAGCGIEVQPGIHFETTDEADFSINHIKTSAGDFTLVMKHAY